jgi:hypothetical protein
MLPLGVPLAAEEKIQKSEVVVSLEMSHSRNGSLVSS